MFSGRLDSVDITRFNPRPREGAMSAQRHDSRQTSFNPRPREGAIRGPSAGHPPPCVSIRAPVRGR